MRAIQKTVLTLLFLALVALGGWFGWSYFEKQRIIAEQRRIITALEMKLDRAWAKSLVADLKVESTEVRGGEPFMNLTFVQYSPGTENAIFTRRMSLPGEEVYIDVLVAKFERRFIEQGEGLKGKSLLLFRRAFGDRQKPRDGIPLYGRDDDPGVVPEIMRVDPQPSSFERELWGRFWEYANDRQKAEQVGVRVAQGEAPHIKVVSGQVYKLTLRASGGLDITPRLPAALVGDQK